MQAVDLVIKRLLASFPVFFKRFRDALFAIVEYVHTAGGDVDHTIADNSVDCHRAMRNVDHFDPEDGTQVFVLRLWYEESDKGGEWRGRLQNVKSGEVRYFRDWRALIDSVQAMLPDRHR